MTTTAKPRTAPKKRVPKKPDSDWREDQLLRAIVRDRLGKPRRKIIPFAEIEANLKKKGK